ncbi:hypothetical protein MIND_00847100 [Mycena indigotica]|uniref:Uncharacterized protein n=1 Tax=Mycena indigotica TaxID=2126181 RepID=A0A8H6W4I8_9AGAR|nr:uncharacterized protein MIND_00847100 [Mycena indigotica]KAF7298989.1 hypothetical protein MIND_00847100 [Mycena indigotica]
MSPRLLWFFLGAGVGAWWATEKKMTAECRVQRTIGVTIPSSSAPAPVNTTSYPAPPVYDWDAERAKVREFSQAAGDTVAELSEATLNTILQATEALKAKMAEHRALREAERRMEEERRRNPHRLV